MRPRREGCSVNTPRGGVEGGDEGGVGGGDGEFSSVLRSLEKDEVEAEEKEEVRDNELSVDMVNNKDGGDLICCVAVLTRVDHRIAWNRSQHYSEREYCW